MSYIDIKSPYRFPYNLKDYLNPVRYYRELKYFVQRGVRGYDETYYWSFDWIIVDLIINVLPEYKNAIGIPIDYLIETVTDYRMGVKTSRRDQNKAIKLRNKEIDFIVKALREYRKGNDGEAQKAIELFAKRFGTWWD